MALPHRLASFLGILIIPWSAWIVTIDAARMIAAQEEPMRMVFHGYAEGRPRTFIADIHELELSNIAELNFTRVGGELSPDGYYIAFDTCRKADRAIEIARVNGSELRRVVALHGDSCVDLRWSPDGTRLSYSNLIDRQLHIVDLQTGVDTALTDTIPALGWHSWSPAGDQIVYETGRGGQRRLRIIELATWRTRELVGERQFGDCESWAPAWSPRGDLIAFTSCKSELYVIGADGSGLKKLVERAYAPRWSMSGGSLLYLSTGVLFSVSSSDGVPARLGRLPVYGGPFSLGPIRN